MKELEVELAIGLHNAGIGVFGTANPDSRTIFINDVPQGITEGILILNAPTPPPHKYIDTEYTVIDFWAWSPHSDRAKAKLRSVYELYFRKAHFETGNWYISFSQILGGIDSIERDREGSKLFRLSIQFICRNVNHVS